ncbi:uncharacterized protein F5891DRAFT_1076603 [Suillus fuscotomentosus]|uniref:Uncharacterized protein n=1 Tax=Suillus fuscotomentosus TaxID=1912939 RepID=A0AAD4HCD9_9AGAM|nr:uncharacterized protein F5891DRAFT_1076603 [Suillus fuscotomentosus]KAG1887918.1 hypothetical protein F5891DRAFT_1076603 [Suillus fuscotomentosus]
MMRYGRARCVLFIESLLILDGYTYYAAAYNMRPEEYTRSRCGFDHSEVTGYLCWVTRIRKSGQGGERTSA